MVLDDDVLVKAGAAGAGTAATLAAATAGPDPTDIFTAPTTFLTTAWGTMSYEVEVINTFADLIQEDLGPNPTVQQIHAYFEDAEKLKSLKNRSRARGGTIAAFEMAGFKGGSKAASAVATATKGGRVAKTAVGGAAAVATEVPFSSAGEYFGQIAAGQETDLKEVMLEGLAGVGTAPVSATLGVTASFLKKTLSIKTKVK